MFDDFADLNLAIAQQLKSKADNQAAKAAAQRLKRPQGQAEAEADRKLIAKWEAEHLWLATSSIALFEVDECQVCQTESERFVQFMREDCLRHKPDTTRVLRTAEPTPDLPQRVLRQRRLSPMCPDCAEAAGWLLADAEEVDWLDGPAPTMPITEGASA